MSGIARIAKQMRQAGASSKPILRGSDFRQSFDAFSAQERIFS